MEASSIQIETPTMVIRAVYGNNLTRKTQVERWHEAFENLCASGMEGGRCATY